MDLTRALVASLVAATALTACNDSGEEKNEVTLVTHESFAVTKEVLDGFTKQTGITVKVLRSGDAGAAVNQAILTKDNPQGDVFFGVDNTFLSRALDEKIFTPYEAKGLDQVPDEFKLDPEHNVTPVDYGDVCVNYDKKAFTGAKRPPETFADLAKPEYKGQLVVENPATSSPGLAFLLGSIAEFGADGWEKYWRDLKANGVEVVDGWEQAYNGRFSAGSGKGPKPIVVSYASSPPAAVAFSETPLTEAPIGVALGTCFRQVEFAGLLDGAANADGGKKLLDFLLSLEFQQDVPMQMFVFPVREDATLPAVFTKFAAKPTDPKTLPAEEIAANREDWIKTWTTVVLR